jgi:hypothetical protein
MQIILERSILISNDELHMMKEQKKYVLIDKEQKLKKTERNYSEWM